MGKGYVTEEEAPVGSWLKLVDPNINSVHQVTRKGDLCRVVGWHQVAESDLSHRLVRVEFPDGFTEGIYALRFQKAPGAVMAEDVTAPPTRKIYELCKKCKREVTPTLDAWYGDSHHPNAGRCRECWS